jgi:putative aldouronate transport system substrate-binding protein
MHDQYWQFQNANSVLRESGRGNRSFAGLPIVFDTNITPHYRNRPIPNLGRGFSISVKAKDPVRIMRFLNEYMSEEWQRTATWGIEGEDWQYDSNKVPYRTQQQREDTRNREWQYANWNIVMIDTFPKWEGSYTDGYPTDLASFPPEYEGTLRPEDRELFNAYGVHGSPELMDPDPVPNSLWFPTWSVPNPPDGSDALLAQRRMEETMKRMLPLVITCAPAQFESMWTQYVNQLKADGVDVYEAYMQQQLDARIKTWGGK